ncbi:MAG: transposase [Granulosicoccus sp.]|jgi:transposase
MKVQSNTEMTRHEFVEWLFSTSSTIQHTSGGKVKLGSIGRNVKNSLLRSQLITGAMAAVSRVCKREAVTNKDLWIQQLVAR